jgi:acyl carrier protein
MTAGLTAVDLARLHRSGIAPLSAGRGLALLDAALARRAPLLVPADLDLARLEPPPRPAAAPAATPVVAGARLATLAHADRQAAILDIVRGEVAAVFRLPDRGVPDDQPLKALGLDSLMAVELRDRLATRLDARLSATLAFDHPTPADLARSIATTLFGSAGDAPAPRTAAHPARGDRARSIPARAIEELSNEELVSLVRNL